MKSLKVILTAALVAVWPLVSFGSPDPSETLDQPVPEGNSWKFEVFLDDKEIGYHHFQLASYGETRQLKSVASFEYKLLFVRLFHYEHENRETWNGDCLETIHSKTDANGEPFQVEGRRETGEFRMVDTQGGESLPECVMSFAYWNPSFLQESQLLNTQSGEFQDVTISEPVYEELEIRGELHPSYRYSLAAGALKLDLWYSPDRQWLALESEVEGGRTLRYVLQDNSDEAASALPRTVSLDRTGPATIERGL
jgi:hypothetical protein